MNLSIHPTAYLPIKGFVLCPRIGQDPAEKPQMGFYSKILLQAY